MPALKLAGLVIAGGLTVVLAEVIAMWFAWRRMFA